MWSPDLAADPSPRGIRLLVAEDDDAARSLLFAMLRDAEGVASVLAARDGAEAVELARRHPVHVAVLDLNMPRLDGVQTALKLRLLRPSIQIALHSSDPDILRHRAESLGLPLFDKLGFERLAVWVERQAAAGRASERKTVADVASFAHRVELLCALCGYGIVACTPPDRCPMCGGGPAWAEPRTRISRRRNVPEQPAR